MKNIEKVVIAGAGTMGFSFAQIFAQHNFNVTVYDMFPAAIEKAKKFIAINQEAMIEQKEITKEESGALLGRISFTTEKECFKEADFVLEAIIENMEIKQNFWSEISALAKEDTILTTNTSGMSITEIATAVKRPERFCGMHWWNPPHILPLIEVIKGDLTADETLDIVVALGKELGNEPVVCKKDINGFIGNRIQYAILRECLHIVESGAATFEDVDKVMKYGLGIRYAYIGPFETIDFTGIDVVSRISDYMFAELDNATEGSEILRKLVEEGRLGIKSGKGIYDYGDTAGDAMKARDEAFIKLVKCLGYKK
ncbi:MAG: 3-hydroxyacyl-CoA dehydrogenase family protein [Clostridiales bacterium]|nr:3-hydroxyacyl-CoA dehydrogenase family protein [Clostridiales bacterium]